MVIVLVGRKGDHTWSILKVKSTGFADGLDGGRERGERGWQGEKARERGREGEGRGEAVFEERERGEGKREGKKRKESSDGHILVWETGRLKLPLTETGRLWASRFGGRSVLATASRRQVSLTSALIGIYPFSKC